jgi:hypothetical protein
MIIIIIMMATVIQMMVIPTQIAAVEAATTIATMMITPYSLSQASSTFFWPKWALKLSNARKDLRV